MRTAVRETSLDSYRAMGPKLGIQQQIVLDYLSQHARDFTRNELARATGLPLASICGRCHELIKIRMIEEGLRRPCRVTGNTAYPVKLVPAQRALFS